MSTLDARQTVTTRAVHRYMTSRHLSIAAMASLLDMHRSTLYGRLQGVRRWTADDLDRLVLLGVEVPALGMPEAVVSR